MTLTTGENIAIIAICAVCTFITRALPFLVFAKREVPRVVQYLGKILPMAVMTTLVAYCLKDMSFYSLSGFAPYIISVAVVVALHLWKRNTFLSIVAGTVCYMLLVQFVFI